MKIIKSKESDSFDKICHAISKNEKEKYLLVGYMISLNTVLPNSMKLDSTQTAYIRSMNEYIKTAIDINNRELDIYKKMLHYLQLLLSNNIYHYYTESYYYDYFEEILKFLRVNRNNRSIKNTLMLVATDMGIKTGSDNVTIAGDARATENLLTDEVYNEIMRKIPRR